MSTSSSVLSLIPNMGDDVRITVIATGFDRATTIRPSARPVTTTVEEAKKTSRPFSNENVSVEAGVRSNSEFTPVVYDTKNIDLPAFLRNRLEDN